MNGWRNYQTWNVALRIQSDEFLAQLARQTGNYARFISLLRELNPDSAIGFETPDGVAWKDSAIDVNALNETIFQGE